MKKEPAFPVTRIMEQASKDPQYQQLLQYYQDVDQAYRQLSHQFSQEDSELIDQLLAAGEAVYFHFSQIAYQCGKQSRKK